MAVTLYAELLKLALAGPRQPEMSISELVPEAVSRREALSLTDSGARRVGAEIDYDCVLIRLCDQLGLDHDLLGDTAGHNARRKAEDALAAALNDPVGSTVTRGLASRWSGDSRARRIQFSS